MNDPAENKLRQWRVRQPRLVNDLAREIGCTRQTWHSWETGGNIPSAEFMAKLVEITNGVVQPNDFYALPAPSEEQAA
jgi:DNA-binding XRE family transcriptional regulator